MAGIYPVPTTRTTGLLAQVRLISQLQSDQVDILRLQSQISTGRRILSPSEDAPAAQRASGLQRLLELKAQARVNLDTSSSYLDASDSALSSVSQLITQIQGTALTAADSTASETSRRAAAEEVQRAIEQLVSIGNQNFRGRYLFAGSRTTVQPFQAVGSQVVYNGNEGALDSYVDTDLLLASNVGGGEIFGAFSPGVSGNVDLNPIVTADTRLTDLRGGRGITQGSIAVSDGVSNRIIDLGQARTVGDVVALIEANPPSGRTLSASITPTGLTIALDDGLEGNLSIREVGGGTTAAELGIFNQIGTGTDPIVGGDLNPRLQLTTRLADILGARAAAVLTAPGPNNDIRLTALERGAENNNVTLQYVDDSLLHAAAGLDAGNETVNFTSTALGARAALPLSGFGNNLLLTGNTAGTGLNNVEIRLVDAGAIGNAAQVNYDASNRVLTLGVDSSNATTAQTLVDAINAEGTFSVAHDPSDPVDGAFNPTAAVQATDAGTVRGQTGNSGAAANTILVSIDASGTTANQVVAALTADPTVSARFVAEIDGGDNTSPTAAGQGSITGMGSSITAGGSGVEFDDATGLQIVNGGQTHVVSFAGATSIEDLLNRLNGSSAQVLAEIDATGTGINIRSRLSGSDFRIGENGGSTATQLGVRSLTEDTFLNELNYGRGITSAEGTDFTIVRNDGVSLDIDISAAKTLGDVLRTINDHPANSNPATRVEARLAAFGNGIELVDDNPAGGSLQVTKSFLSEAAWDLGLVPAGQTQSGPSLPAPGATARLEFPPPNQSNTALHLTTTQGGTAMNGIEVVFQDTLSGDVASAVYDSGTRRLTVSIDAGTTSANTVAAAINVEGTFSAELDRTTDLTNNGSGPIASVGLQGTTDGGGAEILTASDPHPLEVAGVFNTLIRLKDALSANDLAGIERASTMLGEDLNRVNFARAEIGTRGQSLDLLRTRLEDEEVQLKTALSDEIETDFTEALSNLAGRQAALQATLQLSAQSLRMTLLDFL